MTAEEFFKKRFPNIYDGFTLDLKNNGIYLGVNSELYELMESYNKHRVDSLTNEKYKCTDDLRSAYNGEQVSKCVMYTDVGYDYFTDDYVLWLEEQLLKQ